MFFPISSLFFIFFLLSGSILSISSSSWFGAWIGLELNLLSFIPLITIKMNPYFSEAALKYFLIQALASTIIILSSSTSMLLPNLSSLLLLLALLLKLGVAPFHFWFPQVMEGLSWPQTLILMSIQKLAPMFLISYLMTNMMLMKILILFSIFSALIGAIGGLNVLKLRTILAYSSINHMSWMLIAISINDMLWLTYFLFYVLISSSIIFLFNKIQAFSISDILNSNFKTSFYSLSLPLALLSLGGLPPFSGFIPKWMMIQILMLNNMFIPLFFLLISALITLYFYLRILIPFLLMQNLMMCFNMKLTPYFYNLPFTLVYLFNSLGLIFPVPFLFL
uniref:NADH-ubiquinone oxidoreductase chain 2 n=1 Tax=Carpilius maculatus TaxID=205348 RepID=A0A7D3QD45_9EUCA|nr:NADH dehydrogenase subunit 2 [Carpilius maculatus]QKE42642.1 NADH dehydrogenase subunit 2 [Carpilius maculatus]